MMLTFGLHCAGMNPGPQWGYHIPLLNRGDGVLVAFTSVSDPTTPELWINGVQGRKLFRLLHAVPQGSQGAGNQQQTTSSERCVRALVSIFFKLDFDGDNKDVEQVFQALIDKATMRNTNM